MTRGKEEGHVKKWEGLVSHIGFEVEISVPEKKR